MFASRTGLKLKVQGSIPGRPTPFLPNSTTSRPHAVITCADPSQGGSRHAGGTIDRVGDPLRNGSVSFPRERENHSYAHTEVGRDRWFRLVIGLSSNRRGLV